METEDKMRCKQIDPVISHRPFQEMMLESKCYL